MKRVVRLGSIFAAVFLSSGLLLAVLCLPRNFSRFHVTLHQDTQGGRGLTSCGIGPSFGGFRLDDFLPGSQTHVESHIAWVSPQGVTLRLHLRKHSEDHAPVAIDKLIFLRTDRAERIDLTPQIYLTSEIQSN